MKESDKLPEPIFTPSTKAETGHDENIDIDKAAELLGGRPLAEDLKRVSVELYEHAAAHALRSEDVLTATGSVVAREPGTVNPDLPTGEVELVVSRFEQLAEAIGAGGAFLHELFPLLFVPRPFVLLFHGRLLRPKSDLRLDRDRLAEQRHAPLGIQPQWGRGFTADEARDTALAATRVGATLSAYGNPTHRTEGVIRLISEKKQEPAWMLEWRLRAFRAWREMAEPGQPVADGISQDR